MAPTATSPESTRGELGQGLYSLDELRRYVALDGTARDGRRVLDWLTQVLHPVRHRPKQPDYSFSDLISLFVVRELIGRGVPAHRIRDAEEHLRKKWGTDRPFVSESIATDGRHVYSGDELVSAQPAQIEAASLAGQQTMIEPIKQDLRSIRYHEGQAEQWHPAEFVVLDPGLQFGDPVIEGTRVPVRSVAAVAAARGTRAAARTYGISLAAAEAASRFQQRLASALS